MEQGKIKSLMNLDFASFVERLQSVKNVRRYTHRFNLKVNIKIIKIVSKSLIYKLTLPINVFILISGIIASRPHKQASTF